MIAPDLTALEALGIAIRSEIDAQELYKELADKCNNDLLKNRLLILHNEEKRHQTILENIHKQLFSEVELKIPPTETIKKKIFGEVKKPEKITDLLKYAIDLERKSKEFYLDCAELVQDLSGKRMFRFLADMEFNHQMMLTNELEMIEKYPTYFEQTIPFEVEQSFVRRKE
jgi:rubrerythrin